MLVKHNRMALTCRRKGQQGFSSWIISCHSTHLAQWDSCHAHSIVVPATCPAQMWSSKAAMSSNIHRT